MEVKEIDINKIVPYKHNPRNNEKTIPALMRSIEEFGFQQPLVLDKNLVVVVGHTRLEAAKRLGFKTLPCIVASDLSDEKIKAFRLADNKVGELSTWNEDKLRREINELLTDIESKSEFDDEDISIDSFDVDFDIADFGFDVGLIGDKDRKKAWGHVEKKCNLKNKFILRRQVGSMIPSFYSTGPDGMPIAKIKEDPAMIDMFADNLIWFLQHTFGENLSRGGWCIITPPRRRHKEGVHFATEICRKTAASLSISFYPDALSCASKGRFDDRFDLLTDPNETNVILYDDIITTGQTIKHTKEALIKAGHVVFCVVAIRNG